MTLTAFETLTASLPYRAKGMFPSELFLFLNLCEQARVTLIIESGVKNGHSTQVIAAAQIAPLISIDYRKFTLAPPDGVTFLNGDARTVLPPLLVTHRTERIAVLLDGPKRDAARALKDVCLQSPAVQFVACHDQNKGLGETLHSHHAEHRALAKHLDAVVPAEVTALAPYGPGLAVWTQTGVAA